MNIGEVIRKYRKIKTMTQEEMANRLGVTAPAVNKWENGVSYPDILLLPPIARLLGISLDTLLSFHNELTEEEIGAMVYELDAILREKSYEEGFLWAKKRLEEHPNCERLIWQMAVILDAQRLTKNVPDSEKYEEYIFHCYTRALESQKEEIRTSAADSLFGFHLRKGEYEKAEGYLAYFSEQNPERRQKQALIYSKTNRMEEAYKAYEELLFSGYQRLNAVLSSLFSLAMEEKQMEKAHRYAGKGRELAEIFEMGEYHVAAWGLELAVAKKDGEALIDIVERMFSSIDAICGFCKSPLYEHMKFKEVREEFFGGLKQSMLEVFRDKETCSFLQGDERWERLLGEQGKTINRENTGAHPICISGKSVVS